MLTNSKAKVSVARRGFPGATVVALAAVASLFAFVFPAAAQANMCVMPPEGLVGWWPGNGTADDVAGGRDGMLRNGAGYAPGLVGQAFSFDGVDDYVEIPDNAAFDLTNAVTLSAWVYLDSKVGQPVTIGKAEVHGAEERSFMLYIGGPNGEPGLLIGSGTGWPIILFGPEPTPLNVWNHIVGTYDGSRAVLYMNGRRVAETVQTVAIHSGTAPLRIGGGVSGFEQFDGLIDDPQIYNRALTGPSSDCATDPDNDVCRMFLAASAGMCLFDAVTADVAAGGTLTTDIEGDGATADDPLEVMLTTPIGGRVSLTERAASGTPPVGFQFLNFEVVIEAVDGDPDRPLILGFIVYPGHLPPGSTPNTVQIFRNGVLVSNCDNTAGIASPDPCVARRSVLANGNFFLQALTSAASIWQIAAAVDSDGDGIPDGADKCPTENAAQFDADGDGCRDTIPDLIGYIAADTGIDAELKTGLLAKVRAAGNQAERANFCPVINLLNALRLEIAGQSGKKIVATSAIFLANYADSVAQQYRLLLPPGKEC